MPLIPAHVSTLEFKNFRGFADLKLASLQRVNLVVGRNNSGKTSLLEGIALLADPRRVERLPMLLRPVWQNSRAANLRWLLRDDTTKRATRLSGINGNIDYGISCRRAVPQDVKRVRALQEQGIETLKKGVIEVEFPKAHQTLTCQKVSVQHHSPENLVKVFANAVKRKNGEERIEKLLREVDSRIRKVRLYPEENRLEIVVDIGLPEALPVSEVGQGIYRLIAIFSELVGENPDICIIDEIENGIHHSMLEQDWAGIAAAARDLGIPRREQRTPCASGGCTAASFYRWNAEGGAPPGTDYEISGSKSRSPSLWAELQTQPCRHSPLGNHLAVRKLQPHF